MTVEVGKKLQNWICCMAPHRKIGKCKLRKNCGAVWTQVDTMKPSPQDTPESLMSCDSMMWITGPGFASLTSASPSGSLFFLGVVKQSLWSWNHETEDITRDQVEESTTCFRDEIKRFPQGLRAVVFLEETVSEIMWNSNFSMRKKWKTQINNKAFSFYYCRDKLDKY